MKGGQPIRRIFGEPSRGIQLNADIVELRQDDPWVGLWAVSPSTVRARRRGVENAPALA